MTSEQIEALKRATEATAEYKVAEAYIRSEGSIRLKTEADKQWQRFYDSFDSTITG